MGGVDGKASRPQGDEAQQAVKSNTHMHRCVSAHTLACVQAGRAYGMRPSAQPPPARVARLAPLSFCEAAESDAIPPAPPRGEDVHGYGRLMLEW